MSHSSPIVAPTTYAISACELRPPYCRGQHNVKLFHETVTTSSVEFVEVLGAEIIKKRLALLHNLLCVTQLQTHPEPSVSFV